MPTRIIWNNYLDKYFPIAVFVAFAGTLKLWTLYLCSIVNNILINQVSLNKSRALDVATFLGLP